MADYLVQISENTSQSTAVVTDGGDSIAINLVEDTSTYSTTLTEQTDTIAVGITEAVDNLVVNVSSLTDNITVTVNDGGGGGAAAVFVTDVVPVSGVVGTKVYTWDGKELISCSTDHDSVRVIVGCEGGPLEYTPEVTVADLPVTLTESSTKRWFTGSIDVPVAVGANTIQAVSNTGSTASFDVLRRGAGPAILSIVFGPYPGTQTELKSGDIVSVTITTEPEAAEVILTGGTTCNSPTFTVTAGVATGNITIGSGSGAATFTAIARNDFGTPGVVFTSPTLTLNQTYPSFGAVSITYPAGQGAAKNGDSVTVSRTVTNADTVSYSATGMTLDQTVATVKTLTVTSSAYVANGTNYSITANRAANDATSIGSALVLLATDPPTAAITIATAGRLSSSPAGVDYEVRITPSQTLTAAPALTASIGTWQGAWTNMGSYWKRSLRIFDTDARGTGTFGPIALTNLSLVAGSTITSGSTYTVGGLSLRTLVVPAFSRVVAIGGTVSDVTKTSASVVGGNTLVRQTNNNVVTNGFYIANADGSYNANGTYLGMSDAVFAGSNTGGTLQLSFQEAA